MKIIMVGIVSLMFWGCGLDSDTNGGPCSSSVISDYNSMNCGGFYSCAECEADQAEFLRRHPGINCTASTGYGLDERELLVTEAHIQSLGGC